MTEIQKLQAKAEELEKALRSKEQLELKRTAAAKHGLPDAFVDRLKGETLEEMEEDAKKLAEVLPKPEQKKASPGVTNPGEGAEKHETRDEAKARLMGPQAVDIFSLRR